MRNEVQHNRSHRIQLKLEGRDFEVPALLLDMIRDLEWSKLFFSSKHQQSIFCCPLCGGVRPEEYQRHSLQEDKRYLCGHYQGCPYHLILKENLQDGMLPKELRKCALVHPT